jgi:hypothetical protein
MEKILTLKEVAEKFPRHFQTVYKWKDKGEIPYVSLPGGGSILEESVMKKREAIRLHCLEYSGGSPKEVTLCQIVDCPLWEYRFGYSIKSKQFMVRMEKAKRNYPNEYQAMLDYVSDLIRKGDIPFRKGLIDTLFAENELDEGNPIAKNDLFEK